MFVVDSQVDQTVKSLPAVWETWVHSLDQEDLWRRAWQPTSVFLPGEFHGQRSLVCYSPWGRKESDITDRLHFPLKLILIKGHLLSAEQTIQQQRGKQKDPFTITQVRDNDGLS